MSDKARIWTLAVDRTKSQCNGDRIIDKNLDRLAYKWYAEHPDAWELIEVVPRVAEHNERGEGTDKP